MLRLIWAELKKILLNRKTMIGIFSSLIILISFFSLSYWQSMRYLRQSPYHPDGNNNSSYTGKKGEDVIPLLLNDIENKITLINNKLDTLNYENDIDMKELYYNNIDMMYTYNSQFSSLTAQMAGYDVANIKSMDDLQEVFGSKGDNKNHIEDFILLCKEIDAYIVQLRAMSNFVFFKNYENFQDSHFVAFGKVIDPYNNYEHRIKIFGDFLQFYFDNKNNEPDFDYYKNRVEFNIENVNNLFSKSSNIFNTSSIPQLKSIVDKAIGFVFTRKLYEDISAFINDSAITRLNNYSSTLLPLSTITSLTKSDSDQILSITNRYNNMYHSIVSYMDKVLLYNTLSQYSDNIKEEYTLTTQENKYSLKKTITLTEYIIKNNLHFSPSTNTVNAEGYSIASPPLSLGGMITGSFYGGYNELHIFSFVRNAFSVLSIVIIAVCISLGGGSIAGEQSKGTIKMLMIRPYKRWKILSAKLLSTLIVSLCLMIICVIALFIMGLLLGCQTTPYTIMAVFNASNVVLLSPFGELMLQLLLLFISLIIYTIIATFFSAVLKAKTAAIMIALLSNLLGTILALVLGQYDIFRYFIFSNTDLYMYFGNGPMLNDMTFGFSAFICTVYVAAFGFLTYYFFGKKDLN